MDVVALGELLIDFTIVGPPTENWRNIRGSAGGAPANVLATVSRLGGTSLFIGKVGRDTFGDYLAASLSDIGIDTCGLLRDDSLTTLAFVQLSAGGERSFTFERNPGADTQLAQSELNPVWFQQAKVFHFGSLSLTHTPSRAATWAAVQLAKDAGSVISFDPNLRPPLWTSLDEAKSSMLEGIRVADIVKVSDDELTFLTGESEVGRGLVRLRLENPEAVIVITMGSKGSLFQVGDTTGAVASLDVKSVDTTAAGDAFFGAFLYGLTRGDVRQTLSDPSRIESLLRFANIAGALTTTKPGAFSALPTLAEIKRHLP